MKRRIFALLCVIALCVPVFCCAITNWCDNCDDFTEGELRIEEEYEKDGWIWGRGYYICSQCKERYAQDVLFGDRLRTIPPPESPATTAPSPTDPPADPPQEDPVTVPSDKPSGQPSENPTESLPPQGGETTPEVPVTYPPESNPTDSVPPAVVTTPGENTTPSVAPETPMAPPSQPAEVTNPPAVSDPPVIIFTDPPVETDVPAPETQMPDTLSPETMMPVINENTPVPVTNPPEQITTNPPAANVPAAGEYNGRNYRKYPLFSGAFPSRRLNLEGDPDAFAEVPGVCIIENADLQKLLEVAFGI